MDDFQKYLNKQLENEEFRKEYESLVTEHLNEEQSTESIGQRTQINSEKEER